MKTEIARKLAASTAAGALGVLLIAAPALAQGQPRDGRAGAQAQGQIQAGGEVRGGQVRGGGEMRGGGRARVDAGARSNLRAEGNFGTRGDVRVQSRRDGSRSGAHVRVRDRADTNIRAGFSTDRRVAYRDDWRFRDDNWRFRNRGTSVSVGFGFSDPYYAYGYDDGYYSYAASEPYYARRGYRDGYYAYGAAPGCTCPAGGAYASWNTGWGGHGWGFSAW